MASNHAEDADTSSTADGENIFTEEEIIAQLGFTFSHFGNSTRVKQSMSMLYYVLNKGAELFVFGFLENLLFQ